MRKDEAKTQVLRVWRTWRSGNEMKPGDPLLFYSYLRENHAELLNFRSSGDKYQVIAGWVTNDPLDQLP